MKIAADIAKANSKGLLPSLFGDIFGQGSGQQAKGVLGSVLGGTAGFIFSGGNPWAAGAGATAGGAMASNL